LLNHVEGLFAKVRESLPLRGDSSRRNVREARRVCRVGELSPYR
jgi:hypothetical protein